MQSMPVSTSVSTNWHSLTWRYYIILNNEILIYVSHDLLKKKITITLKLYLAFLMPGYDS